MKTISVTPEQAVTPVADPALPQAGSIPAKETEVREEEKDRPFCADYFGVKDWGALLLEPKLDVNKVVQNIVFLEDYLSDKLKNDQMVVDKESFRSVLEDIEKQLGIDSKNELSHRVKRVCGFLKVVKYTKEKEELRKKKFLSILEKQSGDTI